MLVDTKFTIEPEYTSPLTQWDKRAMVRRRFTVQEQVPYIAEGHFFKPELVPLLSHPTVRGMGINIARQLQILHLYRYLEYTEILELQIVNTALTEITKTNFPAALKLDAYKIYTDEGYHAVMALELQQEIESKTGVQSIKLPFPSGLKKTQNRLKLLPTHLQSHGLIVAAAVNEMLISANLAQADDPKLLPAVRSMIHDHAIDEAVHNIFFSKVFLYLWSYLDFGAKIQLGKLLPAFIVNFLEVDIASTACDLVSIGFAEHSAINVATTAHEAFRASDVNRAAQSAISTFRRANVFSIPEIREEFRIFELID